MRQFWLGCILLSTVLGSAAATLGRQSGSAVIGSPLDVRVQIVLAPGEELDALCLGADVNYGDTLLPAGAVTVAAQRTTPGADASVRVQVARIIDEPIVSVNVRAGCNAPFSRHYVFLADPVTEARAASPQPVARPGSAQASPDGAQAPAAGAAAASGMASADAPVEPRARLRIAPPSVRQETMAQAPTPSVVRRRPVAPVPPPAPRLQLDPVDIGLSVERDPTLRLSMSLLSEPTDSEETRAAAGRLWKAINASAEDILRDAQKLSVLEAEAQGLRSEEERHLATIAELQASLERSRYMDWLVYLLAALLLMAVAALVLVWRRKSVTHASEASTAWWSQASRAEMANKPSARPAPPQENTVALDFDLAMDSGFDGPEQDDGWVSRVKTGESDSIPSVPGRDKRDFLASAIGGSRSLATEELFDVQQQADFFVSLGEDEQAIQVLLNHLAESHEPSPLAYLDLFRLYHRLDRRDDYERLRTEFNEVFNAGAPPFDQYSHRSRGLETYETAFTRIQALWGEPRVLDVIEHSIFREAEDAEGEVFDLEAYRELLLLHAIAKDLVQRDTTQAAAANFQHTRVQPLKAAGPLGTAGGAGMRANERNTEPMESMPPASPRLGLDIDLMELAAYSEFEASLPDVPTPVEPTAQPASSRGASGAGPLSNLIDFEVLDFMPPDEEKPDSGKPEKS